MRDGELIKMSIQTSIKQFKDLRCQSNQPK